MLRDHVPVSEFARLVGIGRGRALRAFSAFRAQRVWCPKRLRKFSSAACLPVRQVAGISGAPLAWAVLRASIPRDWYVNPPALPHRHASGNQLPLALAAPRAKPRSKPVDQHELALCVGHICGMSGTDEGTWRAAVTKQILSANAPPARVVSELLVQGLTWKHGPKHGKPVSRSVLMGWCAQARTNGFAKLQQHGNTGRQIARALTWHALDQAMAHLPLDRQRAIATEVNSLALGAYERGAGSAFNAAQTMLPSILRLARLEGIPIPAGEEDWRPIFTATEAYMIEANRKRARKAHLARNNAQAVSAEHLPRLHRHRERVIELTVKSALKKALSDGSMDTTMRSNYGVGRRGS